jgi:hypothetical protein
MGTLYSFGGIITCLLKSINYCCFSAPHLNEPHNVLFNAILYCILALFKSLLQEFDCVSLHGSVLSVYM